MELVINKMFDRCFDDNQYNQAIGIALESRRLDKLREAIERSGSFEEKLSYTFSIAQKIIKNKDFRTEVLRLLLAIYETS
jgi:26S proteasome regulatory subunit N2